VQTRLPPQRLRRYLLPPLQTPNQTDEIFLAQILGHKLPGPNAILLMGPSKHYLTSMAKIFDLRTNSFQLEVALGEVPHRVFRRGLLL
jgi:hypothetical protein